MIYNIKKKLQFLFKKFSYGLFKLFYGQIRDFEQSEHNSNTQIASSKINEDFKYNVYYVNNSRIYTDTINDTAIIQKNKVIVGPSFQIRETKFEDIKQNIVFTKGTPRIKKKIHGNILSLLTGGAGNNNYWHWLFDVLPRLKIFENINDLKKIDFFLFPNTEKKFQKESLDLLKIPIKKRLSSIKYRHLESKQIIATGHPYVINNDASNEIQNLPLWIIEWLKKSLTENIELEDKSFPQNIYIDRGDANPNIKNLRKIINEEEIINILKNKNFKIVRLSDLSISDQIKLFFNAKYIIGLHGAGFANVIFSKNGLKMLELKPSGAGKMCENLAKKCNVNYDCISVTPEKFNNNNQMGHIKINLNELERKI